jgi:streptogramin lyase
MSRILVYALATSVIAVAGCSTNSPPPNALPTTTARGPALKTMRIQAVIELPGKEAYGLATNSDAVWAIAYQAGALSKIDPQTSTVAVNIPLAGAASVLAMDDVLWVAGYGGPTDSHLYRIDAQTGRVAATIETGELCCDLTSGGGSIWTVDPNGSVIRIDPATNQVAQHIPVTIDRNAHTNAVFAGGALWVSSDTTKLFRVDPNSAVATSFDVGGGVPFLAENGLVWGASPTGLWAVDEKTGTLARQIPLTNSTEVMSLGLGYGSIWVGIRHPGRVGAVLRLDQSTGAQIDELTDVDIPARIAVGFGSVWITDSGGADLYRISPEP